MKIALSASGEGLDAPTISIFGRSLYFALVDTDSGACDSLRNPALSASGGAGIQAAQFVAGLEVQALVTGNVGPNAFQVLSAAQIPVYLFDGSSVRQGVEAFIAGTLTTAKGPSAQSHTEMAAGTRRHGQRGWN